MSAIGGILSLAGKFEDHRAILARLGEALAARGPDGQQEAHLADASMVYRPLEINARCQRTRQPVSTPEGWLVAWDGRLDNQRELRHQLQPVPAPGAADVEWVIGAYRRWGSSCCERLVGDFALALWDAPRRQLLLARDPFGSRSLFFAIDGSGAVLWASSPKALLATGRVSSHVDDDWLVAFMINAQSANGGPYRDLRAVPPGSRVLFGDVGPRTECFWRPEDIAEVRHASDEDYEEAFCQLFTAAVGNRLRASGTVCAELSGGLDSSSIVCVADQLIRQGTVEAERLITCSHVFDRASGSDEREYISAVEAQTGRPSWHILEDEYPLLEDFERPVTQVPHFWQLWPAAFRRTAAILRQHGARSLLSGVGGDHLLWSAVLAPFHLADHAARLRLGRLAQGLLHWRQHTPLPLVRLLWSSVVQPLWNAAQGRGAEDMEFEHPWLGAAYRRRTKGMKRSSLERGHGFLLPSRRSRSEILRSAINDVSWLIDDAEFGIERSCPYLDRPLVEFCLGIPFEQHVRPGEMRSLHRRSLRHLLPEKIVDRKDKRGPGEAVMRAVRREWPVVRQLFDNAQVVERGYVEPKIFLERLEGLRFGMLADLGILIRVLQVEVWLRALEPSSLRD